MAENRNTPHPPTAPRIHRKFLLSRWQWIGVPVFLLIPVFAFLGVLGELTRRVDARTVDLAIELEYPRTHRYKLVRTIELTVTNITTLALDTVAIDLDTSYAAGFATRSAIPAFDRVYGLDLIHLAPGETRRVRIDFEGLDYGRREGHLSVTSGAADTAWIPLRTFIFP